MLAFFFRISLGLCALLLPMATADFLPAGFIREFVVNLPVISGTWVNNPRQEGQGMLLLSEKGGEIYVIEDPDASPETVKILDLGETDICVNGERGLQSAIPHPDFQNNFLIYVFYTKFQEGCLEDSSGGAYNVVARYLMDPITLQLDLESRDEVWRGAPTKKNVHNGGAMLFGVDGMLYVSTGDGGDSKSSQLLNSTHGSIMRLNDDGSVPDDNPFTVANGYNAVRCADSDGSAAEGTVCSEVFANGLRNPFRFALDVNEKDKVKFTVSDVGGNYWEELDTVGTDFPGKNYGYPMNEGVCSHGSETRCPTPTDDNIVEPFHWYAHMGTDDGGCVSGAAHVPDNLLWPSEYKFLFAEFVFREIYTLIEDPESGCRSCRPPTSAYRNETFFRIENSDPEEERITDIFFAPYQNTEALYVLTRGGSQGLTRIRYTDVLDNSPPVPAIIMPESDGLFAAGESLEFDGTSSTDADGDELTYFWDFGDGETSTDPSPTHSFAAAGEYTVTLTVTDTEEQEQQISEIIAIGEPPKVMIVSPGKDEEFFVGQIFNLRGLAFDYLGVAIPDERLTWEVRQHHANHFHPFLDPTSGNNIKLSGAPEPEDFFASTNSHLRIILTATDMNGLTSESQLLVQPQKRNVTIDSFPPGVEILVENYAVMTPKEIVSWQNHFLNVLANDAPPFQFRAWSDGEIIRERKVEISENNQEILALYCAQDLWYCTVPEDCCGGLCIANSCESDSSTENHGWPVTASTNEIFSVEKPANGTEDQIEQSQEADNDSTVASIFGKPGTIVALILAFFVILSPFLVLCIRKRKQRLEAQKDAYSGSKDLPVNKYEHPAGGRVLSAAASATKPPSSRIKVEQSSSNVKGATSVSNSKSVVTALDTGSSFSSANGSSSGDEVQENISVEEGSRALEGANDFVDLESPVAEKESSVQADGEFTEESEPVIDDEANETIVITAECTVDDKASSDETDTSSFPAPPSPPTSVSKLEDLRLELAKAQSRNKELSEYISNSKSRLVATQKDSVLDKDDGKDVEPKDIEVAQNDS